VKKVEIALILILVIAFAFRVTYLTANPPPSLTWSHDVITDTPWRAFEARNLVLFGNIRPLGQGYMFYTSPAATVLFSSVFVLFGIGYFQIRLASVMFGVLSLLVFYFLSKEVSNQRVAMLATVFFAFSYTAIMYSRMALMEIFITFFLLLSLFSWVKSEKSQAPLMLRVASVLFFLVSFFFKPTALVFTPVLVVAFFSSRKRGLNKPGFLQGLTLSLFVAGFLAMVSFLDWRFFDFSGDVSPVKFGASAFVLLRGIGLFFVNNFLIQSAVLFFLSIAGLLLVTREFLNKRFLSERGLLLMGAWLFSGALSISLLAYQPPRYFLILLPPMCFLSAIVLERFKLGKQDFFNKRFSKLFFVWCALGSVVASLWVNKFVLLSDFGSQSISSSIVNILFFALVFFALACLVKFKNFSFGKKPRRWIFLAVICVFLLSNMVPFFQWAGSPSHSLIESSKQFSEDIPKNSVVLGEWVEVFCIETVFKCLSLWDNFDTNPLEKFKPTHFLLSERDEEIIHEKHPGMFDEIRLVKVYEVNEIPFSLYEVIK